MTEAWLTLEPDERIEWDAHPRLLRALPSVLVSIALAAAAVAAANYVDTLALAGLLVAPIPAVYGYLSVVNTRFVLTNRALYRKRGIVGIDVRTVELARVQNTRSKQGILGTAFGYGTVEIEVAGGADLRFFDVYDPDDVRALVEGLAGESDAIPGTLEQWRAVRDELRAIRRVLDERSDTPT